MAEPLMVLKGRRWWEWRPDTLYIHDDHMVFENRGLIAKHESTITYAQVAQVNLHKGIFSATLELVNTGGAAHIVVKNLPNKSAQEARDLIEAKVRGAQT